ncbi:MAG: hypothetical protein ABI607_03705 [Betaproteobacteria bacterium]
MLRLSLRTAISFASWLAVTGVVAQPMAFTRDTQSMEIAGVREDVDIYRPGTTPSIGVAIVAHGFARSRIRHKDLGQALAQAGITTVIPDLPNVVDLWGNGDAIAELAQQLESGRFGIAATPRAQIVLIGTSAGGLATILAAARLPGLAGWIGLDPVDRTGSGASAATTLDVPAVVLLGGGSTCNLFGSGRGIAAALPRLVRSTSLKGASHCDFEDPTNNFCRALCGKSSASMQVRIRNETVRAALDLLHIAAGTAEVRAPGAVPETSE